LGKTRASIIVTTCHKEQKPLLTIGWDHEDVELIISRLSWPEVRDTLSADQLLNPFVVFSGCKLSKSMSSETRERYIDLTMERNDVTTGLQNVHSLSRTPDL